MIALFRKNATRVVRPIEACTGRCTYKVHQAQQERSAVSIAR